MRIGLRQRPIFFRRFLQAGSISSLRYRRPFLLSFHQLLIVRAPRATGGADGIRRG